MFPLSFQHNTKSVIEFERDKWQFFLHSKITNIKHLTDIQRYVPTKLLLSVQLEESYNTYVSIFVSLTILEYFIIEIIHVGVKLPTQYVHNYS